MMNFWNNLTRNQKGLLGFGLLSILFGFITEIAMVIREVYQYKKYLVPCGIKFEWDDILRYTVVIIWGCCLHYGLLFWIF